MDVGYLLWLILFLQLVTSFALVTCAVIIAAARGWQASMGGREDGRATLPQWLMWGGVVLLLLAAPELILVAAGVIGESLRRAAM